MGFKLDQNTVHELAAAIASEVVKALTNAQLVTSIIPVGAVDPTDKIQVGPLTIDYTRHDATVRGRALHLRPREFDCLAILARNAGHVLTRTQLLELAWKDIAVDGIDSERTVDVHIRRLRVKLAEDAHLLRTVTRVGYRLDPD